MKQYLQFGVRGRSSAIAFTACVGLALMVQPAWAVLDYSASLGADFAASYAGGLPISNPFGEWELRGRNGLTADLTAVPGGIPASGQAGWCMGAGGVCNGDAQYSYFSAPWQPGVTVIPGIGGHGVHDVRWTAPANVDEGGVSITGSIEQLFETARRMRLSVFKNGSATAEFTVDALPPIVNGVVLQRVNFGPIDVAVNAGDTLQLLMDGSGAGGNNIPTFVAWNVVLDEARVVVPEPASAALLLLGATVLCGLRRRGR